jgi:hypothetical protein
MPQPPHEGGDAYQTTAQAMAWSVETEACLEACLPVGHPTRLRVTQALNDIDAASRKRGERYNAWLRLVAAFSAAYAIVKADLAGSFEAVVRRDAEADLLGSAGELVGGGYRAAAAVLAGGALEIHLRGLCERQSIAWVGKDQIENYRTALVAERKKNPEKGIDHGDAQAILGWATLRNDAAHDPVSFAQSRSEREVEILIESVRMFIDKTTPAGM